MKLTNWRKKQRVLARLYYYNKIPQTGLGYKKKKIFFHSSKDCKSKIWVPVWLGKGPLSVID